MPDRRRPRAAGRTRPGREPALVEGARAVASGTAELVRDGSDGDGWLLLVNGVPSSYVHLRDPTRLEFEYVRWIGDVLDAADPPPPERLRVMHLGGAGCTLPRYVAATRPGSRQLVCEHDPDLAELARTGFGVRRELGIRIRTEDARAGLAATADGSQQAVVRDAFDGSRVPAHLTTLEYVREVDRVLAPGGLYVANVADRADAANARVEAVTALAVFRHVALVAEPGQLRGRRYGNVLVLASRRPLPVAALTRTLASGAVRARLVPTRRVTELVAGLSPRTDADG